MTRVGIVGGGAWGTALALVALRAGGEVVLWARDAETAEAIDRTHRNPRYLPEIALPEGLRATTDPAALAEADIVLLVVPAQSLRATAALLEPSIPKNAIVVLCAKGIELGSGQLMSAVATEALPGRIIAVLSGPTFADEVARDQPTAVTIACADAALGARVVSALGGRTFRPYLSGDTVGTEVGGAIKNVLAIACGIAIGGGLGVNARAALITRGLVEVGRLGKALGGRPESLMGLAGIGDLVLSCTSPQSRNFSLGIEIAKVGDAAAVLANKTFLTEGAATASSVVALAQRLEIDMPICTAVDAVLHNGAEIAATVAALLDRPFRTE